MQILLVEDHTDTAKVLSQLLRRDGHEVKVAASCEAAAAEYLTGDFDLCLIDRGLPDGDGGDLLGSLLECRPTTAIMLSGYGTEQDIKSALDRGFAGFVVKPTTLDTIRAAITKAMKPAAGVDGSFVALDRCA